MGRIWPLQDAKAKLSQLIRAAEKEPQTITRHGAEVCVLLSPQEYQRLLNLSGQKLTKGLPRWWVEAPKVNLEIPRRSGRMRKVEL